MTSQAVAQTACLTVVILHDPYKENNPNSRTLVILTNGPVNKPFKAYDAYDVRSEIENSLFREAEQAWFIQSPSRRTETDFRAHAYLIILIIVLPTAYQFWLDQQYKLESDGLKTGIRKFREQIREENGNKLIIFDQDRYAIFGKFSISLGKSYFATIHWIPAFAGMTFGCKCPSFLRKPESRHPTLSY